MDLALSPERWGKMSPAEKWAMSPGGFADMQDVFTDEQIAGLLTNWEDFWARPAQCEPPGDWTEWLLLTGR